MDNLNRDDVVWAAGFVDGEGCLSINQPHDHPQLAVSNTHRPSLERLQRTFGGSIGPPVKGRGNQRDYWVWCARMKDGYRAIEAMLPHMTTKRVQAKMWLNYIRYKRKSVVRDKAARKGKPRGTPRLSTWDKGVRRWYNEELKTLKRSQL